MTKLTTLKLAVHLALAAACLPAAVMAEQPQGSQAPLAIAHFRIEGMLTKACPALVKRAAGSIDGVRRVEASLETRTADVEYDSAKTSVAEITRVIEDRTGFRARPVTTK